MHQTPQPDLNTATYGYDPAGQLLTVDYSATSGVEAAYTYDAVGRPLTMTDATGTSSFDYDVVGRLISEINGAGATTGYGYDDAGQLTTITYPGSRTVVYGHDAAGQMTSLTDWSSNTTDFAYTLDGQLASRVTPDGVSQSNAYDLAGQLTSIAHMDGVTSLASFDYAYDAAGQLTNNSSTLDGTTIASDYGYDPVNQLASVTTTPSGGTASVRQLDATPAGLLTATLSGHALAYNTAQQVTTSTPLLTIPTTFAYDARGARVSETTGSDVKSFAYTASGALASVTTPSTSVAYTSDARNLRQSRTEGGVTQQFTWSSAAGLPLLLDDGQHFYLYGPSSTPLAQVDNSTGEIEYLHSDLLGTPRLVTDDTGTVIGTATYDAFGTRCAQSGVQSAFGFTGNLFDESTGLLYLRSRDYDSATGQFLTVDPLVDQTRQPYAYVRNNPTLLTDPWGLADWWDVGNYSADNWQDAGAVAAGIGVSIAVGVGIAALGVCTAATAGLCLIVGGAIAGGVGAAVTYGLQSGDKSVCGLAQALGLGLAFGAIAGPIANLLGKIALPAVKSLLGRLAVQLADDTGSANFFAPFGRAIPASGGSPAIAGANFAQTTARNAFSVGGRFGGQTIDDVAQALASGRLAVDQVPVDVIVRSGNTLILNTRSALALTQAGVPRSAWNVVDRSGQEFFETLLSNQLGNNGLTDLGVATVRITGR